MPTISQLPSAGEVSAADQIPISQSGSVRAVAVGSLLANVQPAILAPTGVLLGRTSLGAGGPDPVYVGIGLSLNTGTLVANGTDHLAYPLQETLDLADEAVLNSSGTPRVMPLSLLRGLYSPGTNITIDQHGTISSASTALGSAISALPTVSSVSEGDLVAISHNSADYGVSYANLIDGQTIDEIQSAAAPSDEDWLLVGQGGSTLLRQTLMAVWSWLTAKLPSYLLPTLELTSNTALAATTHNGHILLCSQPITMTAASSDLGSGFSCSIINMSAGNIVLGSNIATSSGSSLLAAGQTATLNSIVYSGGNLVYAAIGAPSPSASPPAQVTGLATTSTTSTSVSLNWTALSLSPTSYVVQYRVTGAGTWSGAPSVTSPECTITGLVTGTSYDLTVTAVNGAGAGPASAILTVSTVSGLALPGQVASLLASSQTSSSVSLSWAAPIAGGPVASYTVQYRLTSGASWSAAASGITATAYLVTGLTGSTSYDFQVVGVNATGSGIASATITTSTTASAGSVTAVTWNLVPAGSYTHGSGTISVNAHITPSAASVQFAFSTSIIDPPASWTPGNFVNSDLWGAYVDTPPVAGTYYVWVEGTDGSLPSAYPTGFLVI